MLESILDAIEWVITNIGSFFSDAKVFRNIVFSALGIFTFHTFAYKLLGFFATRKFKPTNKLHKYAIVVAARNESSVIGNLLDSIAHQDYPSELIDVFVVADNCTDNTAEIVRSKGAVCYERFDNEHRTKGFALQFLFENIRKDYGIDSYEGYFVFDADNLLNSDYITRMNEAFDAGEKIVTSYRNTKNFDENWIASTYAIHWLRSIRFRHRARSVLRLATNIQGTGFLFAHELVKNGWNYTSLTEDRAFTADAVAQGYPISYCDAAVFYDEQPTSLKIALRQRLRWSKGHLMALRETGPSLFLNIFTGTRSKYKKQDKKSVSFGKRFVEGIRCRWASFDTLAQLFPSAVVKVFLWLVISIFMYSCYTYANGLDNSLFQAGTDNSMWESLANFLLSKENILTKLLYNLADGFKVVVAPGIGAMLATAGLVVLWNFISRVNYYICAMFVAVYVFFMERKRIIKIPLYKKILYVITWPIFDVIGRWTTYFALFMKVEWKPIPHTSTVTIDQIEKATEEALYEKV